MSMAEHVMEFVRRNFLLRNTAPDTTIARSNVSAELSNKIRLSDDRFEASHPELREFIPTIQTRYAICPKVVARNRFVDLNTAWQHVSSCGRCKPEIESVRKRNAKIAREPIFVE